MFDSSVLKFDLVKMITNLPSFFNALEYDVSATFPIDFFSMIDAMPLGEQLKFKDLMSYEHIIEPLVVKSEEESRQFHSDYVTYVRNINRAGKSLDDKKIKRNSYSTSTFDSMEEQSKALEKSLESQSKKIKKLEEMTKKADGRVISEALEKKIRKDFKDVSKSFKKAFGDTKPFEDLLDALSGKKEAPSKEKMQKMRDQLKNSLLKAALQPDYKKLLDFANKLREYMKKLENAREESPERLLESAKKEYSRTLREQESVQKKLDEIFNAMLEDSEHQIIKERSSRNRPTFQSGTNSVIVTDPNGILSKPFQSLSTAEKQMIRDYIEDNARKFRTRISRNIKSDQQMRIDYPTTIRKACQTNGIPIELAFMKPKKTRANILMFLDISGSCKEASEQMLTFMHLMADVFPGGTRSYVFVNSLYDVSCIFRESMDLDGAIKTVMSTVPTRGVYSDYNTPFKDFYENHFHEVSSDTIVFILGDMRNNKNPNPAEYIKAICRKAKRAYLLNTEGVEEWDNADSIMSSLSPYASRYSECKNTLQLLNFLMEAK